MSNYSSTLEADLPWLAPPAPSARDTGLARISGGRAVTGPQDHGGVVRGHGGALGGCGGAWPPGG